MAESGELSSAERGEKEQASFLFFSPSFSAMPIGRLQGAIKFLFHLVPSSTGRLFSRNSSASFLPPGDHEQRKRFVAVERRFLPDKTSVSRVTLHERALMAAHRVHLRFQKLETGCCNSKLILHGEINFLIHEFQHFRGINFNPYVNQCDYEETMLTR